MASLKRRFTVPLFITLLGCPHRGAAVTGVFGEARLSTASAGASGIVRGFDNGWWFTEFSANKIGRYSFAGDVIEFSIPTPDSGPLGIVSDLGAVWFTEFNANKIGRITPDGVVIEFSIPTPGSGPFGIAVVSDSVWFSESNANKIGRLTRSGTFSEIPIPTPGSMPMGVWGGTRYPAGYPVDTVLFAEFQGNRIGVISLASSGISVSEIAIPTSNSGPLSLSGESDQLWFTEVNANRIGLLTRGSIVEFPVPTPNSGLSGISSGGYYAGTAWFTERSANKIGLVTTEGRFTEYSVPTPGSDPFGITGFQVEGQVIFTERAGNAVTRLQPDAVLVLAAKNVGGWTTEFDVANVEDQRVTVLGSGTFPPIRVCGVCPSEFRQPIGPRGSAKGNAGQIGVGRLLAQCFFVRSRTGSCRA